MLNESMINLSSKNVIQSSEREMKEVEKGHAWGHGWWPSNDGCPGWRHR